MPSAIVIDTMIASTWCVRTGHSLGAKNHEADRWVAAVAGAAKLPPEIVVGRVGF